MALDLGSGAPSLGDDLLRPRTARYGLFAGLVGAAFWVSRVGSALVAGELASVLGVSLLAQTTGVLAMFALWLLTRRPGLSAASTRRLEIVCSALACTAYCALVLGLPQAFRPDVKLAQGLAIQLLGRAVYVPSSARRTALLSALVSVPYLAAVGWTFIPLDPSFVASLHAVQDAPQSDARLLIEIVGEDVLWWLGTVIVSTSISAVIYGLRREVRVAKRLGQYTVLGTIGRGGMGEVYRARHALLRRETAVKVVQRERVGEASLARFEREVQATAALSHPNTVTIFDYGRTHDGELYYAMELLDGATLTEVVRLAGPLKPARVAHVLAQVGAALAEAHDAGLIHRDVKPDNVLLTRQGGEHDFAKVVDFGLVKEVEPSADTTTTKENTLVGTPLYMAPECIRGEPDIDGRSDLYALGAVGYYLLTGEHVFEGKTVVEICGAHLERPVVPPSIRLGAPVPADLEALVLRCLEKDRAERPTDARAFVDAVRACACFGEWTDVDGARWWRDYGPELERGIDPRADTLAIALGPR